MSATIEDVKAAMADGARLDIVRLIFNPTHKWGVQIWKRGVTRGGNDKWDKVVLILPNDGETVVDVLTMLGGFAEDGAA